MYEFFVSGRYKRDLQRSNRDNAKKYGTNGDLTEACGTLIQSLGRATYTPQISNALIEVVAKYWQQFHDGGEQDAQEFWIWLMEKMHEDLNKKGRRKLKTRKVSCFFFSIDCMMDALINCSLTKPTTCWQPQQRAPQEAVLSPVYFTPCSGPV
jgi:Ubiquitin carboxyl-terminal hydrolase